MNETNRISPVDVFEADIFIIPNSAMKKEDTQCMDGFIEGGELFYGKDAVDTNDIFVQIWATGCGVDNWSLDGTNPLNLLRPFSDNCIRFPSWIPLSMIEDKSEGDVMDITVNGQILDGDNKRIDAQYIMRFTLNQLGHRYKQYGNFEEVLANIR